MEIFVQRLDVRIDRVHVRREAALSGECRLKRDEAKRPEPNADSPKPVPAHDYVFASDRR
jgi:hypothetical protein